MQGQVIMFWQSYLIPGAPPRKLSTYFDSWENWETYSDDFTLFMKLNTLILVARSWKIKSDQERWEPEHTILCLKFKVNISRECFTFPGIQNFSRQCSPRWQRVGSLKRTRRTRTRTSNTTLDQKIKLLWPGVRCPGCWWWLMVIGERGLRVKTSN